MDSAPGSAPEPTTDATAPVRTSSDEMFTVPVPRWDDETLIADGRPAPSPVSSPPPSPVATQAIPYGPPVGQPVTTPLPTFVPYAAEPASADAPPPPLAPAPTTTQRPADGTGRAQADVDPLLGAVGVALFWITVGWWVFVLVRVLGRVARDGVTDRLLIETVDRYVEETVIAAILSVLAAILLLLGRGRSGRDALGWSALALAVVTVAVAVWRVLP